MSSDAQRKALLMGTTRKCLALIDGVDGIDYAGAHNIAYNLLDSIEARMRQLGVEIPTYTRKLGGQTRADRGNFCYCRRCNCTKRDERGFYCTAFYVGPKRQRYYVSEDDGCARGIPRKEYR